ncbi:MAG TPA: phosphonate ABC transporter ATP-binding protein [Pyrinomonadaceae bacterium]|nr:phosphonate ABC transporter ATP-binding protein [Pyrinomonadaceae bacterium]
MIYSLREVSKSYPAHGAVVRAVNGFTLDVQPGERIALLGPSGAGKTTLFRLLNATLRPTSGTLQFDGSDVGAMSGRELRSMRRRIGTIYQQFHLVPSLTALENTLCGRLGHWSLLHTARSIVRPAKQDVEQAMAALEVVGLADKYRARADELSGGQQQRLTIARVLMQDPEVILADEPFASLDPSLKESLASLLTVLVTNGKRTLVTTLHDVDTALRYFPRIVALRNGRVAFDRTPAEIDAETLRALYDGDSEPKGAEAGDGGWRGNGRNESRCATSCTR